MVLAPRWGAISEKIALNAPTGAAIKIKSARSIK
jgi:hypothetical protein